MASETIAKKTWKVKVQWWDNQNMYIICPWCKEIHRHGFNGNYSQRHRRAPHCDSVHEGYRKSQYLGYYLDYEIEFPVLPEDTFEIDKDKLRFVAGGARVPDEEDNVPEDKVNHMKAAFRESIERKRKWTEAIESQVVYEDFSNRKIVLVVSEMVRGNVEYVRKYLDSSSEADIFLHGVYSREMPPCDESDDESEGISTKNNVVETEGVTALHMAACESSSEMVELLLSKGVDANATDYNGRTALMEAALWGRLENVEILLKHRADKSKKCIDGGQLRCAADFAKALKQNEKTRRRRAGGCERESEPIYKEDTYARNKDREDIVSLLEGVADEPGPYQLDACFYQRSPNDRKMLSLTMYYSLPTEWKTVALMIRSGGLPEIAAMSGWTHGQNEDIHVPGQDWTKVLRLCKQVKFNPEPDERRDQGEPGRFNACHAEKQLIAYFVHRHRFLECELPIPERPEVESLFSELTLEEHKTKLVDLWKISPSNPLKEAKILVSSPLCDDCRSFVKKVNNVLGLDLKLYHRCLESTCKVCSN
ncbi:hypothetical protein F4813DRAFT_259106 [Daldinia decipiens]|uniref:uncharacterized protein n=1 Tax=Daldinia decipiens TaxID=326647 RepID=UPI0020C34342|nr:uncharacterized protein F4813DRAFT_259106 [Daldinia decipiens]KAI1653337.1 hypothetical protein F4813DRAFT_259106 [Daldinia decipiens]